MTTELRNRILERDDLGRETVHVPEWDEDVTVRGLTAGEAERFGKALTNGGSKDVMARLVSLVVIEPETGARVFTDKDVEALSAKNTNAIRVLFDAAQKASGLTEDEDLEGN